MKSVRYAIGGLPLATNRRGKVRSRNQLQTFLPFGIRTAPRTGENDPVSLAGTEGFVGDDFLARFAGNRPGVACVALADRAVAASELSDRSAYRLNRAGIAAEPPDDPRDIDSAPAGIAPLRLAAQLGHRQDPVDRLREIDAGIGVIVTISVMGASAKPQPTREGLRRRESAGDPGMTRTCDLRFRKPSLYPAELRDRGPAG